MCIRDRIATDRVLLPPVLTHLHVSPESVVVIPNGIDLAECDRPDAPARASALRATLGLGPADVLMLSVGRLEANKGYAVLVDALAALTRQGSLPPNWRWVL